MTFLLRRLAWSLVFAFAATLLAYVVVWVAPKDPAERLAGRGASATRVEEVRRFLELDRPHIERYGEIVGDLVLDGSLGESFAARTEVRRLVVDALGVTGSVVGGAIAFWLLVSVPLGTLAALGGRSTRAPTRAFAHVAFAVAPVYLGLLLAYFVGFKWDLTPISGYCDAFDPETACGGVRQWAFHLRLPWATLGLGFAAIYTRAIRAAILRALESERAREDDEFDARRVAVRAAEPILILLRRDVGIAFGAAVFAELVFGLPGLGHLTVQALSFSDLPVVYGALLATVLVVIALNLVFDVLSVVTGWRRATAWSER